jgi:lipoprotein-anchoring transpeptidase ErfK/SrfK
VRPARALLLTLPAFAALALSACSTDTSGTPQSPAATSGAKATGAATSAPTSAAPSASSSTASAPAKTVRVSSLEGDGATYGVGMPIVLRFTPAPTDSSEFTKAATVTVNGQPADGAWYWEQTVAEEKKTNTYEAHYRPKAYWPANATIAVKLPIGGLSAGKGLVYSDKLTSITFHTGDAHISTVDGQTETMKVTSNGALVKTMKVSLGKAKTPTYNGTKIVMQKGEANPNGSGLRPDGAVRMVGTDPADRYNLIVPWSVRVTMSGEYVHAASWNGGNIGVRSTSNGCTNLSVSDAKLFYKFSQVGDVVTYSNTGGTKTPSWDGYGDWNVPWGTWARGGLLLNH